MVMDAEGYPHWYWHLHVPYALLCLIALDEGMDWPLQMPAFVSLLASTWPLPTPAPTNAVFGEESGCCWITLCTSLPVTLAEEVLTEEELILGVKLGKADRVVSTVDEEISYCRYHPTCYHSG